MSDKNKPMKYARYAIGEIILVVLGILIALQINNWNEQRKHQLKIDNLFTEIQDDLLVDIKRLDHILADFQWRDSVINLALKNKLTKEDYLKTTELRFVLYSYEEIYLHRNGYDNLMNYIDYVPAHYKPLIDQLKFMYTEKSGVIQRLNERLLDDAIEYLKGTPDSKEMTYRVMAGELDEEIIDYFLNSKSYKHDLQYRQINLKNFKYLEYRNLASNLYADIAKVIETPEQLPIEVDNSIHDPAALQEYLGSYQMKLNSSVKWEISQDQTEIALDVGAKNKLDFCLVAPDTFNYIVTPNTAIKFQRNENNEIIGCAVSFYEVTYEFDKIPVGDLNTAK